MAAPSLSLHIDNGRRKGETLTLAPNPNDQIRIGRIIRGNTFTIKDPSISQHHLAISFLPALSLWSLTDLSSSNGTHLNNTLIPPNTPAPLSHGDLIRIGETTRISVRVPAPPPAKQKFGNPEDFKRDGPASREGGRPTRASSRVVNRGVKLDEENIDVVGTGSESSAEEEWMDGEKLSKLEEIKRDGPARREGGRPTRASSRVMSSVGLGNIDVAMRKNLDVEKLSKEEEVRRDGRARRRVVGKKVAEQVVMESKSGRTRGLSRVVNSMGLGMNLDEENIDAAMENNVCVDEERIDVEKLSKPEEIRRNGRGRQGVVEHKSGRRTRASSRAVNNMGLGMNLDEENIDVIGSHLELGAMENNVCVDEEDRTGSREKEAEDERVDEEMDKMTMADWFDRMEEFLPKEINRVAEEIIESIREKACRFDEYIDHLAKSKYN